MSKLQHLIRNKTLPSAHQCHFPLTFLSSIPSHSAAKEGFILYTTSQLSFMNGVCHLHNIRFRWDKRPYLVTREKKLCDKVLSPLTSQMISLSILSGHCILDKSDRTYLGGEKNR
ncbi:hypothetical protein CDAR_110061 [Caerostris darwini]|uniref:Uncharacterized protein n=1 Tax=Caerostris darwini TaxID=1538125 RepID=A0AAV4P6D3_9ARAC|nr:hypothetical protein CDAR_110061 [Caerostris darwini]